MLMQNLGEQTKSIMVFSGVAYNNSLNYLIWKIFFLFNCLRDKTWNIMKWKSYGWNESLGRRKFNSIRDNDNNQPKPTKEN